MSRRWRGVGQRRGTFSDVFPVAVPAAPTWIPDGIERKTRPAGRGRRGVFFPVVGGYGQPAAFGYQDQTRRRAIPARRGQFHEPPWPQVAAPAAPAFVLRWQRYPRRLIPSRPGLFYGPTWEPPFQPTVYVVGSASPVASRAKVRPVRRGERFEPPWGQVAAQPSVWRPGIVRATPRLAGRPFRRGRYIEPPWVQGPQTVWRPDRTRQAPRLAGRPIRRGQYYEPPWPQGAQAAAPPFVPQFTRARRPFIAVGSRDRYLWTPPRPVGVPAFLRTRVRSLPALRKRGRFHEPRWVEGPQTVWRPGPVCPAGGRPRWPTHRLRRARYSQPPWPPPPPPTGGVGVGTVDLAAAGATAWTGTTGATSTDQKVTGEARPTGTTTTSTVDHQASAEGTT